MALCAPLRGGCYRPPSLSAIRSLPIRVDPVQLDAALRAWHEAQGGADNALAIDGKTIRGAIDADGNRVHVPPASQATTAKQPTG